MLNDEASSKRWTLVFALAVVLTQYRKNGYDTGINQNLFGYLANPVFHRFEVPSLTFSVDFTQKTYLQGANLLKNSRLH